MQKKIGIVFPCFLSLLVFFAGCNRSASSGTSSGGEGETVDSAKYAVTEPVRIEWWHALENQYAGTIEKVVNGFNSSQNLVTVEARYIGSYGVLNETLVAAHAAGTGLPAISAANTPYVAEYGSGGLTEDLNPYIKATNFDIGDFGVGLVSATAYEGKQVALPFLISTQVIYYNADMAKELGRELPLKWSDMDSFLESTMRLKKGGGDFWGLAIPGWDQWYFETFYRNQGINIINPDGVSTDLDSPKAIEVAQKIIDWCNAGYAYWASGTNASNIMRQNFWDQKLFAISHTSSLYNTYVDNCDFEVGMAWLPGQDTKISEIGGSMILIPAKADQKSKNAGWQFMQYMISKDVNMLWAKETGYMPTRKSVLDTGEGQQFVAEKPAFKVIFDNLDQINPRIQHKGWSQLATIWMTYMAETVNEHKNVPEQMKKMAAEINEVLADL
ncbi:MAG: extracellular solute-binding protein [Treponema sp.]|jgi:multiple sugar transport system substrate-binding protein|nr:extracellular solute-binding protein [Treponema sp.]